MERVNKTYIDMTDSFKSMSESEKIMYITENVLGATSEKRAVSMDTIIGKGIELGIAIPYPRNKKGDHPWFPHASAMMGVLSSTSNDSNEEIYFHRTKVHKSTGGVCMLYWVDRSHRHEIVSRKNKCTNEVKVISSNTISETLEEKMAKVLNNPDKYILVGDKVISKEWALANPEKFNEKYGSGQ